MPGLLRGVARTAVIAGTATSVSNRVSKRQGERWAAQEQQQYAQEAPPPPPPPAAAPAAPAAGAGSTIDQLKELGELKAQGILTEEEFAAQKAKLLGS
jgi:putative oligomerization/nucleic acid binding protein